MPVTPLWPWGWSWKKKSPLCVELVLKSWLIPGDISSVLAQQSRTLPLLISLTGWSSNTFWNFWAQSLALSLATLPMAFPAVLYLSIRRKTTKSCYCALLIPLSTTVCLHLWVCLLCTFAGQCVSTCCLYTSRMVSVKSQLDLFYGSSGPWSPALMTFFIDFIKTESLFDFSFIVWPIEQAANLQCTESSRSL